MLSQLVIIIYVISLNIDSIQARMNNAKKTDKFSQQKRKFFLSQFLENYVKSLLLRLSSLFKVQELKMYSTGTIGITAIFLFFCQLGLHECVADTCVTETIKECRVSSILICTRCSTFLLVFGIWLMNHVIYLMLGQK